MRKYLLNPIFLILIGTTNIIAQVSPAGSNVMVNANATPAQLVAALVDPSIAVSGIISTCPASASGTFTDNGSNLGISSGVVLTSGTAASYTSGIFGYTGVEGPNTDGCSSGAVSASSSNGGTTTDTDLKKLAGTNINDVCKIEFDMVAPTDSLQLTYVFGSEEYDYFAPGGGAGSSYNDAFGFFMSGPGITVPPGFTGLNFATIPGTASYVGIKTVNRGSFYYRDNCTAPPANSVQYNALTKVLTAKVKVQTGKTYHIKLGIADATDASYDSGVFIKAGSIKPITPLPVGLVYFIAENDKLKRRNKISWKTSMEINNSHFELLKRSDRLSFNVIANINGSGTSTVEHNYEYFDEQHTNGVTYYMLRQIDFDGKVSLSNIVSLENYSQIVIKDIFPNPVKGKFTATVEIPEDVGADAKAEIIDIAGRVVYSQLLSLQTGANNITVNTEDLQTGTYFFRVVAGNYTAALQRIVK